MAALRKTPFELRIMIYDLLLSDDTSRLCKVKTSMEMMNGFERALIPYRDLYREFLQFRIKNSILSISPDDEGGKILPEFEYPSTKLMCPIARDSIREVIVEIPGYPEEDGQWTHSDMIWKEYPSSIENQWMETTMLPTYAYHSLKDAKRIEKICFRFHTPIHNEVEYYFSGMPPRRRLRLVAGKYWVECSDLLIKSDLGSYLNSFPCLHTFEILGKLDPRGIEFRQSDGICSHWSLGDKIDTGGGFKCAQCRLHGTRVWSKFDEHFNVEPKLWRDDHWFGRRWSVKEGESLRWK